MAGYFGPDGKGCADGCDSVGWPAEIEKLRADLARVTARNKELEAALREAVNRIGSDWDSCSCDNVDGVCGFCRFQEEVTALLAGRVDGERKER